VIKNLEKKVKNYITKMYFYQSIYYS